MSGKVMGAVWELDLPHNRQSVLLAMADHADHDGGNIFASVGLIAWKCGYSERETQRIMHTLVAEKLLVCDVAATPRSTAIYHIDLTAGKPKPPRQNVTPEVTQQSHPIRPLNRPDSDSSLRSESGAPADSLGKEIDDLPDSPQLKIAKAAKAIATLSKRSESDLEVPPLRCPVEECGGLLDDQLRCPICNRRYRHDSIAPGALALLFAPGTVVSQGKNTIAIADDKGNLVKPVTDFYVVLDDKAIGPFPSKGKGPSAECARVADRLHGRVSQSPEERPVKAPPGKVKAPPKPRARNALLDKLASLCYGDVDAAFKMRGIPALLNKALGEIKAATPDVSVGKMAAFAFWWYANDWRGIKGQRPEPQQLPGAWLKFMNGDVVNGTNGNRNLDDDAARRSPDFDWGYPKSGMPVMPGNGNAHGSAASQVEPGPERGVPGAGGDHDPA